MMCCLAMMPSCLACQQNTTLEEFCSMNNCELACPVSSPIVGRYCNSDTMYHSQCEYDEYCCKNSCFNTTIAQCSDFRWMIAMAAVLPCNQCESEKDCNVHKYCDTSQLNFKCEERKVLGSKCARLQLNQSNCEHGLKCSLDDDSVLPQHGICTPINTTANV